MRKAISFILLLITSLCIWGQFHTAQLKTNTGGNEASFYDVATDSIKSFKEHQDEIVNQGVEAELCTKEQADSILSNTFNKLDTIMNAYSKLADNQDLQKKCESVINNFIKEYSVKIHDDKGQISVTTRRFLIVAEKYGEEFHKLIEDIKKSSPDIFTSGDSVRTSNVTEAAEGEEEESEDVEDSFWIFISLGIGLLGFCLGIAALIFLISIQKRVSRHGGKLASYKQELDLVKTELNNAKSSNAKVISTATTVSNNNKSYDRYKPQHNNSRQNSYNTNTQFAGSRQQHVAVPPKLPEKAAERSSETHLFATIKNDGKQMDFYKISNENPGDKPFMLTIAKPEDEVAEFTIAPNLPANFIQDIIQNREVYLPRTACEISSAETASPTRIEVMSPGKAKKVSGTWMVQSPMSIRIL